MILRPVRPASPTGPPISNAPVGLMKYLVSLQSHSLGSTGFTISSITASLRVSYLTPGACWVESTTASMPAGWLFTYFTVTCDLASGRSQLSLLLRKSAWLRLGVRAQPIEFAFTQIGLALHQAMRQRDRHGHEHVGLAGGIAEHQALVAGALLEIEALALVHAGGDIGRLAADGGQHRAAVRAEAHLVGVTDVAHHVARHLVEIHACLGRDLAREHHQVVLDQRLARHARGLVLRQDGVQHGVRDLVTDLVRMTFRYRFRGKKKTVRHKKQPRSG